MEPLFYVMAIMGCSDGAAGCSEQRVMQAHFSTIQQCQAAMPRTLEDNTDLDYPVISAACRANGPRMVSAGGARSGG